MVKDVVATGVPNDWPPCNVTEEALKARVEAGLLCPIHGPDLPEWIVPAVDAKEPNPPPGYVVSFLAFHDRGFGTPASRFMRALTHYYGVELHNFNPNSIAQAAVFAMVCEGYLGTAPHWDLWLHLFSADMSSKAGGAGVRKPLRVGGCTLLLKQ